MPAIPSWLLQPLWDQFSALLPDRPVYDPTHPLGCHRPRISDRIIFEKLTQVLRFGCSYQSIADCACSATTIRERRDEWMKAGIFARLKAIARDASGGMPDSSGELPEQTIARLATSEGAANGANGSNGANGAIGPIGAIGANGAKRAAAASGTRSKTGTTGASTRTGSPQRKQSGKTMNAPRPRGSRPKGGK